jgi:hypothetical protein
VVKTRLEIEGLPDCTNADFFLGAKASSCMRRLPSRWERIAVHAAAETNAIVPPSLSGVLSVLQQ